MTPTLASLALTVALLIPSELDERPAGDGEWGFHPAEDARVDRTPPSFSWRPQAKATRYQLQASRDPTFARVDYEADDIEWSVHCPPRAFAEGSWAWRFRAVTADSATTPWSTTRRFEVADDARVFVLPTRADLLARVPDEHPRLFLRPEDIPRLREAASGDRAVHYQALLDRCDRILAKPPSTEEPPRYDADMVRGSDPWRAVWWGNRTKTIAALESAAQLAFVSRISDRADCGALARRILMDCAAWDPRGSTGYRYNDEAGMPYAYHFSRIYTLLHPLLSVDERARCREVMQVRGREMYRHLAPKHLWRPYSSHSNRAWHFLGEVGIAFYKELPEAGDWVWFAANVFANVYPVWSDQDGGWHEGTAYWRSYLSRFTWWADVQRAALGLDAYALPFFSRTGDWALYLMPPGARGGGFGDQNAALRAEQNRGLLTTLATQARNPYWRWYVEQLGGPDHGDDWIGFLRAARDDVAAKAPDDLPTARCFRGTGVAVLSRTLKSADDDVAVIFKSSPFGSQSHGYEAQNSFLLYAFGERLLIRSGKRDSYGSEHHRKWMWETKSTNNITVDGRGQTPHSAAARGRITGFHTQPGLHWVEGEAGAAYDGRLDSFRRSVLFVEPDLILVVDRLRAPRPSTFEWRLHGVSPFDGDNRSFTTGQGDAACTIDLLVPTDVTWLQTDRFDTPPRERVQLVEHHLTATTAEPATDRLFVAVMRPYRSREDAPAPVHIAPHGAGWRIAGESGSNAVAVVIEPDGELHAEVTHASEQPVISFETAVHRDD